MQRTPTAVSELVQVVPTDVGQIERSVSVPTHAKAFGTVGPL